MSIDDIIKYAKQHQQKYVALVDINVMYGAMEFYQKAIANELTPIIGLQITYQNERVILIAKNSEGYHNLVRLSSKIMTSVPFDINDYINHTYVIVNNASNVKWLKHHKDVYSAFSDGPMPIALQECFFENKDDLKYLKALLAINHDQQLTDFTNVQNYDENYLLSTEQAHHKFSTTALKNLESLINSCT
jgi:DNA polymerase-3 subunit alpha